MPAARKAPAATQPARKAAVATTPVKPATRAKSAPAKSAPAGKAAKEAKVAKPEKPKKPKLVRDSFTIPKPEYAVLQALKERAARLGRPAKKSELLRAGVKALACLGDAAFGAALAAVPALKTGRPAKA